MILCLLCIFNKSDRLRCERQSMPSTVDGVFSPLRTSVVGLGDTWMKLNRSLFTDAVDKGLICGYLVDYLWGAHHKTLSGCLRGWFP